MFGFSSGSLGTKLRAHSVGAETLRPSRDPQLRGAACRPSLGLTGGPCSQEQWASCNGGLQGRGSMAVSSAHIAPDLFPAPSRLPREKPQALSTFPQMKHLASFLFKLFELVFLLGRRDPWDGSGGEVLCVPLCTGRELRPSSCRGRPRNSHGAPACSERLATV